MNAWPRDDTRPVGSGVETRVYLQCNFDPTTTGFLQPTGSTPELAAAQAVLDACRDEARQVLTRLGAARG